MDGNMDMNPSTQASMTMSPSSPMSNISMMMYIHDSTQIYIVFEGWQPTNNSQFIGSCFALLFIASFSNLLVALRQGLTSRLLWSDPNQAEVKYATTDSRFDRSGASEPSEANWFTNYLRNMLSVHHFVQSVLEVVQTFVNFFIMISVMTLNGWLILSIMLGYGVGYFFFRANYKKQQHSSSSHH